MAPAHPDAPPLCTGHPSNYAEDRFSWDRDTPLSLITVYHLRKSNGASRLTALQKVVHS